MRRSPTVAAPVVFVLVSLLVAPPIAAQQVAGGQPGLSEGQLRSAAIEVPRLVELLELKPGMAVADVGAGFGAWTVAFARVVGPSGRVYSNDIGEKQLAYLREAARKEGLTHVTVVEGAERSSNLPPGCCDAILIRDAYHHLTQADDIVRSLAAALKPGGRMVVVDFPPRPNSAVPPGVPANRRGHGVPPEVIVDEVTAAGLTHVRTEERWSPDSQPAELFLLLFRKPAN